MNEAATSKNPILVLDQRATFAEAKKIAGEHNGRLPTLGEFICAIKDPEQLKKLRGDWYWTSEEQVPVKPDGYCRIDYTQFVLVETPKSEWSVLPSEQKAYVVSGSGAVQLSVGDFWFGGRLYAGAGVGPSNGARVALVSGEVAKVPKPAPK